MYALKNAGYGYKKLLSERQFLKVQQRARELHKGTNLTSIFVKEQMVMYKTRSSEYADNGVTYTQRLYIEDASFENVINAKNFKELEKIMLNGGLKVHCNCLAKGTRILTKSGYKTIENVIPNVDYVLSSDGKWHIVAAVKQSELKDNWKKVTLRGIEKPLIVTTDHKLLFSTYREYCACGCGRPLRFSSEKNRESHCFAMFDRRKMIPKHFKRPINDGFERYQMHTLKEYKVGELLCGQRLINEPVIDFDKEYARMLGYYLAEGCIPKKGTIVKITLNQKEYTTIAQDIYDYFTAKGIKVERKESEYKGRKWLDVNVYSKEFREDCKKYCGKYSLYKCPNTEILQWNKESKEQFIIGYLLGDGCIDDGIRFNTISEDLAEMIQQILNTLGIHTFIRKDSPRVGTYSKHDIYTISCPLNKFYDIYNRNRNLFVGKCEEIKPNKSRGQKDVDEYVLYKIQSIEDVEPQVGYDICLFDEPHNYIANGVIVSNCPAFHFWGYKYKAWKLGYGLEKELRRPVIRNPFSKGYVCKHLYLVLETFPFIAKTLASKFGQYWEKELKK